MELYLLKSSAILAILFAFYKGFLENTSIHHFKRFYLFGSLLASFLIPLITLTTYIEPSPLANIYIKGNPQLIFSENQETTNYWPFALWTFYTLGVLFFSLKFFRNLFSLIQKIRKNPQYRNNSFINILLNENVIPHTFFSYIFLNKEQFENHEIPAEVMLHEETHSLQKHSLDIVFVEILQILFWFNPLFYFIKRSIKLNHEFLADRAVLNAGTETSDYQKIILAFSSNASTPSLAHSLNYSSIKKRFTVMKTHTTKRAIWVRSILLLPLLSILIYGFSTTQEIVKDNQDFTEVVKGTNTPPKIVLKVLDNKIFLNTKRVSLDNFAVALNSFTEDWKKEDFNLYALDVKVENTSNDFKKRINTEYRKTYLSRQSSRETPFIVYLEDESELAKSSELGLIHLKKAEKDGGLFYYEGSKISSEKAKSLIRKNPSLNILTENSGSSNSITTISKNPINLKSLKEKATIDELAEYNKLAKKYNAVVIENRIIKKKDLERLEFIYRKMTDEQKANAEPFPECIPPPPPPPPPPPSAPKVKKGEKSDIPPPSPKATSATNGNLYTQAQAPPPPNTNMVEYIKELGKRGAIFYIGPHKYNTEEAIKLVEKSKNEVTIDVSKYPDVLLGGC